MFYSCPSRVRIYGDMPTTTTTLMMLYSCLSVVIGNKPSLLITYNVLKCYQCVHLKKLLLE